MNREINFKAYHNSVMYNVDTLGFDHFGIEPLMCFAHHERNPLSVNENECISFNYNTKFMQFTGLKDKNGTCIYEDDIVSCNHWSPSNYRISFIEGGYCLCDLNSNEWVADSTHMEDSTGKHFEVIGNIHQNPELL